MKQFIYYYFLLGVNNDNVIGNNNPVATNIKLYLRNYPESLFGIIYLTKLFYSFLQQ